MLTSGVYYVDGMLSATPALWQAASNTIAYSFAVGRVSSVTGSVALDAGQQAVVREMLAYVSQVTGLEFQEISGSQPAGVVHFWVGEISGPYLGVTEFNGGTSFDVVIDAIAYPKLANFKSADAYDTLLHEMGHVLGLSHPSEAIPEAEDNSAHSIMSFDQSAGARATFGPYDLLALGWMYGGDGIGGNWGYHSTQGPTLPPEAYPPVTHSLLGGGSAPEGSGHSFTVTRSGNIAMATSVAWAVDGSSANAADFGGTLPSGVVSFASGETRKTVDLGSSDDMDIEADETFTVVLGARTGNGAVLGGTTSASFTIEDNDAPPTLSITPEVRSVEGNAGTSTATFVITRNGNLGRSDRVHWNFSHETTDAADFAPKLATSGWVDFAAGQDSAAVNFDIAGDAEVESHETYVVAVTGAGWADFGHARASGHIVGDDITNVFSIAAQTASVEEGHGGERRVEFIVSRSGVSSAEAILSWSLGGGEANILGMGPAVDADDLALAMPTHGTLMFAPGQTQGLVSLQVKGDTRIESDEALTLRLVDVYGLGSGLGSRIEASTIIVNDDAKGEVSVRATSPTRVSEGHAGAPLSHSFMLTRDGDLSQAASLPWRVTGQVDAADFGTATHLPSGNASFAIGAAVAIVDFSSRGDAVFEDDEALTLTLAEGELLRPSPSQGSASVTLLNDDLPNELSLRAITPRLSEGSAPGYLFEVRRSGDLSGGATATIEVTGSGDNPANAEDFKGGVFPSPTLRFSPGSAWSAFVIQVAQDAMPEADETFTVALKGVTGGRVSAVEHSASATIVTDEPLPLISVQAGEVGVNDAIGALSVNGSAVDEVALVGLPLMPEAAVAGLGG